jgi:hypothetical protein
MTRPLTDIARLEVFAAELDLAHPGCYPDSVRWIAVANHIPNAQNLSREELGAIICVRHDIGHIDPVDMTPSRENPITAAYANEVLVSVTRSEIAQQCARTDLTCGVGWSADQRAEAQGHLVQLIYNLIIKELDAMTVTALVMTLNTKDSQ